MTAKLEKYELHNPIEIKVEDDRVINTLKKIKAQRIVSYQSSHFSVV